MPDKLDIDELEGLRVSEAIRQGVLAERDELRAEVEGLREENEMLRAALRDLDGDLDVLLRRAAIRPVSN